MLHSCRRRIAAEAIACSSGMCLNGRAAHDQDVLDRSRVPNSCEAVHLMLEHDHAEPASSEGCNSDRRLRAAAAIESHRGRSAYSSAAIAHAKFATFVLSNAALLRIADAASAVLRGLCGHLSTENDHAVFAKELAGPLY